MFMHSQLPAGVTILFLLIQGCGVAPKTDGPSPIEPAKQETPVEIMIFAGGAWTLQIRPDGSGVYGFGSTEGDSGDAPAGVFDFQKLVSMLRPRGTSPQERWNEKPNDEAQGVLLRMSGSRSVVPVEFQDDAIMPELFERAVAASRPSDQMKKLIEERAPFRSMKLAATTRPTP